MKKTAQREILDNFFDSKEEMQVLKKLYSEWQRLSVEQDEFSKNKESFLNELNETEEKYNEFSGLNFSSSFKVLKPILFKSWILFVDSCIPYPLSNFIELFFS